MIVLGVVLLLIGFFVGVPLLWTVGLILAVIGLILAVAGSSGRQIGGRAHYW